jgi:hypothetical protein
MILVVNVIVLFVLLLDYQNDINFFIIILHENFQQFIKNPQISLLLTYLFMNSLFCSLWTFLIFFMNLNKNLKNILYI